MSVLIQPAASPEAAAHFASTVAQTVDFKDSDLISPEVKAELRMAHADGAASMWGLTPGKNNTNRKKWKQISVGDLALFTGGGRVHAIAKVSATFESTELAEELWGRNGDGETWQYMYTLRDVRPLDIPYDEFNRIIGDNPKNVHRSFRILNEEQSQRFTSFIDGEGYSYRNPAASVDDLRREDITEAIAEWEVLGREKFLARYQLHGAAKYVLDVGFGEYIDAKALVVYALRSRFEELRGLAATRLDGNERTIALPLRRLGFAVRDKGDDSPRFWWVNQNRTRVEAHSGYMWSPFRRKDGAANHFYDNMSRVKPRDVVFSFFGSKVQAIGTVASYAHIQPKPADSLYEGWADEGWFVEVSFESLARPFRPKDFISTLRPLLPPKYSPIQRESGEGVQGVYLAELSSELAEVLMRLGGAEKSMAQLSRSDEPSLLVDDFQRAREFDEIIAQRAERALRDRTFVGPVSSQSLVESRRGQGVFRNNVLVRGRTCRVTGVSEPHLVASHIKPWRASSDVEKIDGNNGLMLAPHIDHLFNYGWISFENDGTMKVARNLAPDVLAAWSIDVSEKYGEFSPEQSVYLEYHRTNVFERHLRNSRHSSGSS